MYNEFYHLQQEPFGLTPDPHFVYLTAQHREALSGLVYSVLSRPGLTLLLGEAGTGKTTLLYTLRMLLEKRRFSVVLCVNPMLEPGEFYDFLLAKIGGGTSSMRKSQQLLALEQILLKNQADKKPSILMIDEAHRLPLGLLEEIRLLLNLETPRAKLLEIILAGQPELSEVFRRPDLRHLKQRVSYVCRLKPLSLGELREYLRHRLSRAGRTDSSLFPDATVRAVYQYSSGIPRLVNTLCNNCLQIGFALQSPDITISIVEEAAADLDLAHSLPLSQAVGANNKGMGVVGRSSSAAISKPARIAPPNGTSVKTPASLPAIPLESYGARQTSLGFLAGLMDRWT